MNPITALKRRLARRLSKSTLVQKAVLTELEDDPKALAKLGKKPSIFEQVLEGAALSEGAVTRIIDHPAVLNRIMRSPKVFEKLLSEVSNNPEILYRLLAQRNVRKVLAAQNSFLQKIAMEEHTLQKVLQHVPTNKQANAIKTLTNDQVDFLRCLSDTPVRMAAALLYRTTKPSDDVKQLDASEKIILDGVIDSLEGQASEVILKMVESDPSLFRKGPLRDQAIRSIVTDAENMSKLCTLYVINPKNGLSLGSRAHKLLKEVLSEPGFVQALIQDGALRQCLLHIVEDSSKAAGSTVSDMLALPRNTQIETV